MVWDKGAILNNLQRHRAATSQVGSGGLVGASAAPNPLPKRDMSPASPIQMAAKTRGSFMQRMGSIGDTYDFEPTNKPSEYLEQAEELMFQTGRVNDRIQKRLSNPKIKTINQPYTVNVPQPYSVPVAGPKLPSGAYMPTEDVTRTATNKMPKLSQKQTQAYEAQIIKGKSHLGALKAIGVKPIYEKGSVKVPKSQKGVTTPVPKKNSSFDAFVRAIAGKESGGSYSATNPSGASGKYQILQSNFVGPGGWDMETIGRDVSYSEFMNSPKIQDAIARGKLREYYNKYGARGAASTWYSGSPNNWQSTASQGAYPTVAAYVADIWKRMHGG